MKAESNRSNLRPRSVAYGLSERETGLVVRWLMKSLNASVVCHSWIHSDQMAEERVDWQITDGYHGGNKEGCMVGRRKGLWMAGREWSANRGLLKTEVAEQHESWTSPPKQQEMIDGIKLQNIYHCTSFCRRFKFCQICAFPFAFFPPALQTN